jgi:hypothetical protein
VGVGEVAQIMYMHVSKCKNDKSKIKKELAHVFPKSQPLRSRYKV